MSDDTVRKEDYLRQRLIKENLIKNLIQGERNLS